MKKILLIFAFLTLSVNAQEKLNNYKYVVIPSQFDFQKEANQYNLNKLLQLKFKQLGFDAYLDTDVLPREVKTNSCSYLKPVLVSESNMFKTKIKLQVLDCDATMLFETQEGNSSSKSYKTSYNEALRNALKSFGNYRLQYVEKEKVTETPIAPAAIVMGSKFLMSGKSYFFKVANNSVFYKKIIENSITVGTISNTSKEGVYHIVFNGKKGIGYYDETANFMVEFISENGEISVQKFQRVE